MMRFILSCILTTVSMCIKAQMIKFEDIPICGYVLDFGRELHQKTNWEPTTYQNDSYCTSYKGTFLAEPAILNVYYDHSKQVYKLKIDLNVSSEYDVIEISESVDFYMNQNYICRIEHSVDDNLPHTKYIIKNSQGKQIGLSKLESTLNSDGTYSISLYLANGKDIDALKDCQIKSKLLELNGIKVGGTLSSMTKYLEKINLYHDNYYKRELPHAYILKGIICNTPVDVELHYKGSLQKISSLVIYRDDVNKERAKLFYNELRTMLMKEYTLCRIDDDEGAYLCWPSLTVYTGNGIIKLNIEGADNNGHYQVTAKYELY